LLERALATTVIDWQALRQQAERAEERRLPPAYFERFFFDALAFAGGKGERRLDLGTLRVTRSPDALVAASRASGVFRRIPTEYSRLTFDKSVVARPRMADEADLPAAELCGPGHPLFDGLVDYVVDHTADDLGRGAVFIDPDTAETTTLAITTGDVVDGNGELVHRALSTVRLHADGRLERPRFATLYDLVSPDDAVAQDPEGPTISPDGLEMWARQHIFEETFQTVKAEREHVANVQLEFLARSFNALLSQADASIMASEEDVLRGAQGAEGRLRKAELAKATQTLTRDKRLTQARQGRLVHRGPVRLLGLAQVLATVSVDSGETSEIAPSATDNEIEMIAVRVAERYEREERDVDFLRSVESENVGFDLLSLKDLERRCIEVKGRSGVASVWLSWSEYAKAVEIGDDYWLYVVLDCATSVPRLYRIQNPVKALAGLWKPNLDVRFGAESAAVIDAAESRGS
jgi:hypothetical protein